MATAKTKPQLEAELQEANEYIEDLEARLDGIVGMAAGDDEDEADGEQEGDEEDEQED